MAEWSKALHLSCSLFGVVGSNPTPDIIFFPHSKIKFSQKNPKERAQRRYSAEVARKAHNLEVIGSNPIIAYNDYLDKSN